MLPDEAGILTVWRCLGLGGKVGGLDSVVRDMGRCSGRGGGNYPNATSGETRL